MSFTAAVKGVLAEIRHDFLRLWQIAEGGVMVACDGIILAIGGGFEQMAGPMRRESRQGRHAVSRPSCKVHSSALRNEPAVWLVWHWGGS